MKTRTVFACTIASLAFLASTVVATGNAQLVPHVLHLHPGVNGQPDDRIALHLYNNSFLFKEVMVDGRSYTITAHGQLGILAPEGTPVYAVFNVAGRHRGDVVLTVAPKMSRERVELR